MSSNPASTSRPARRYDWAGLIPFVLCHVAVLGAFFTGVTWQALVVCAVLYVARIFGVTAGYHRYFSHRTFETSRPMAFALAWLAQSTAQKGALWWAANHRHHHLHSDDEHDLHSVRQDGFLYAHMGWIYATPNETEWKRVRDLEKYPELVWLNKYWIVPPLVLALSVLALFGWSGLFVGFFLSTVLTWHGTFCINSLAHVWGSRRYETKDASRNNFWLAVVTLGEGWHNNHHHWMRSCRQGFAWWEFDPTYYALRALAAVGLVWGIKEPPARIFAALRAEPQRRAAPEADTELAPAALPAT